MHATHNLLIFSLLVFSLASATAPVPCQTDEDCQQANQGNVCMDGVCGFAQEPMVEETVDDCVTDEFCFNQGYDYCGDDGTCVPHEPLQDVMEEIDNCVTNEFCMMEDYDLCGPNGVCAYESEGACATDDFCRSLNYDFCELPGGCNYSDYYGLSHCSSAGVCGYGYGMHPCTTHEYCQENNFGNECMGGFCGYSERPFYETCIPAYMGILALAFSLFASKRKQEPPPRRLRQPGSSRNPGAR